MSEVSELAPELTPEPTDAPAATPSSPIVRPTLPPRAATGARPVAGRDGDPGGARPVATATEGRGPTLLTAPPLATPPVVVPTSTAPTSTAPTSYGSTSTAPASTDTPARLAGTPLPPPVAAAASPLPPPTIGSPMSALPSPTPSVPEPDLGCAPDPGAVGVVAGTTAASGAALPEVASADDDPAVVSPVVTPALPVLRLGPAPTTSSSSASSASPLAALRLNLAPIDEVAARAAATAERSHDAAPETVHDTVTATAPVDGAGEPLGDIDEARLEEEVEDALAAAAAKSGDPHLLAAAAHFAAKKQAASLPQVKGRRAQKRRRTGRYVVLAVVVLGAAGTAWIMRDSAFMHRVRGVGYDPQAAPPTVFERPSPTRVEYELTTFAVQQTEQGPIELRTLNEVTANPSTGTAEIQQTVGEHPIEDGRPSEQPASTDTARAVVTEDQWFTTDSSAADATWTTGPNERFDAGRFRDSFWMYQDVVDESLRSVRPDSVVERTEGERTLTTYTWTIPVGQFYESAPQISQRWSILSGNAADDTTVTLVLTVDGDGVVWLLDIAYELDAVLGHAEQMGDGLRYPSRVRWQLDDLSDDDFTPVAPIDAAPVGG